jgi:hypothetical protein
MSLQLKDFAWAIAEELFSLAYFLASPEFLILRILDYATLNAPVLLERCLMGCMWLLAE